MKTNTPMGADGHKYICYLHSVGTGYKNDNCISQKIAMAAVLSQTQEIEPFDYDMSAE